MLLLLVELLHGALAFPATTIRRAAPSSTSSTIYPSIVERASLSPGVASLRSDGNAIEGVHSEPSQPLTQTVLARVPELASWDSWYAHPRIVANGHVHTILAAKLRKTRAVKYHRQLVPTPDGGTLAVDLLAGIRRVEQSLDWRGSSKPTGTTVPSSLTTGGALPGAAEEDGFTTFVDEPPPLDPERPMLLLASGLGGGSQDTYVRSMAATAAERGWQVAVINMRACGDSPVTSPRLFSAYRGANDDLRLAVRHLRATRLGGAEGGKGGKGGTLAAVGWSNSGTIVNNALAEQATTHIPTDDASHRIDAAASIATPLNMPANSANLQRPFHSTVYDANLGKSLQRLWAAAREQYVDPETGEMREVPYWDGLAPADAPGGRAQLDATGVGVLHAKTFVADDGLASTARSIRELDEAVTRRQYGYASVDDYYAAASSDQRLALIAAPTLLLNAYDDPIVPGASLCAALAAARANPQLLMALTSHGGHLGWCERADPWGGSAWCERAACGFLEAALGLEPTLECEQASCEIFD